MFLKVTIVRNAQTDANKGGILQGIMNSPLSEVGKTQAKKLGYFLRRENFTRVYTSDLGRAMETLHDVADIIRIYQPKVFSIDRRLRERDYGELENHSFEEYKELARETGFDQRQHLYTPEGGEEYEALIERIQAFLAEIFAFADNSKHVVQEHVLIVTHGFFMASMMRYFHSNRDTFTLEHFKAEEAIQTPVNTGITRMSIGVAKSAAGGKRRIVFEAINESNHLKSRVTEDMIDSAPVKASTMVKKH